MTGSPLNRRMQPIDDVEPVIAKRENAFRLQRIDVVHGLEQMLDDTVAQTCALDRVRAAVHRHREQHRAARAQHAQKLGERTRIVRHVLEHFGVRDEIEALVRVAQILHVLAADARMHRSGSEARKILGRCDAARAMAKIGDQRSAR